jgi:hypothetical protein
MDDSYMSLFDTFGGRVDPSSNEMDRRATELRRS